MKKELVNISARIEKSVKETIENECEINHISFNSMLNKILIKHTKWERFTREIGMPYVNKGAFRAILSKLDDAELKVIAASGCRSALRDATLFINDEFTLDAFTKTLDLWLEVSHISFKHSHEGKDDKYIIQHDMGTKYSIYLSVAVSAVLSEIGALVKVDNMTDQNLVFQIEANHGH
ncbi:MAG: hypothetical protein HQ505_01520 [Nitrosopumilus sp.]|nr:hypothetical protein [Nitrosopumilus sp.]